MNIQELIDKQVWIVIKLQKQDYLEADTKDRMIALAAAIEGLRNLQAIAGANSKNGDHVPCTGGVCSDS